jgi:HPr kinase/phosphorylase
LLEVSVRAFFDHVREPLDVEICAGERGLEDRLLRSPRIQKPGLALAGFLDFIHIDRVQVLGQTELTYLGTLSSERRREAVRGLVGLGVACVLITKSQEAPAELVLECQESDTPLLRTSLVSAEAIRRCINYLEDLLTPRTSVHGVLVDVDGVGILMTGVSGIGKSETALDLVLRGHRLVADDVVEVRRRGEDLVGQASELIQNLIEIRGLGILNVSELYGVAATRLHKRIELHVEFEEWRSDRNYDRLGLDQHTYDILGVKLTSILLPIRPGRNVAALVEVAARNLLLQMRGHSAPRELKRRIDRELNRPQRADASDETNPSHSGPLREAAGFFEATDHIEDEVE